MPTKEESFNSKILAKANFYNFTVEKSIIAEEYGWIYWQKEIGYNSNPIISYSMMNDNQEWRWLFIISNTPTYTHIHTHIYIYQ